LYKGLVHEQEWRGEKYWAKYTSNQMYSLSNLLPYLTEEFNIGKNIHGSLEYDKTLLDKDDLILFHSNARLDKTDVSPAFDINLLKLLTFPAHRVNVLDYQPIFKKQDKNQSADYINSELKKKKQEISDGR